MSTTTYTTHIVYKTTNLVNNKIYIGIHSTNDINDGYLGSGRKLVREIEKYGEENFSRAILYECSSRDIAAAYESFLVNEKFLERDDTYNIRKGGERHSMGKPVVKLKGSMSLTSLSAKERRRLVMNPRYKL